MITLLSLFIGYIVGSLPYGLILVKIFKNQDIREIGSKNIGATNVLRAGYKTLALFTLLLDMFKGIIAIAIVKYLIVNDFNTYALAGIFAIIGHIYPVWLKFKGGKGIATSLGVVIFINPLIGLFMVSTWFITAIISKYSSLSAIIAFILLPIYSIFLDLDFFYYSLFISAITLYKHKENIVRLIKGKETKIVLKK